MEAAWEAISLYSTYFGTICMPQLLLKLQVDPAMVRSAVGRRFAALFALSGAALSLSIARTASRISGAMSAIVASASASFAVVALHPCARIRFGRMNV